MLLSLVASSAAPAVDTDVRVKRAQVSAHSHSGRCLRAFRRHERQTLAVTLAATRCHSRDKATMVDKPQQTDVLGVSALMRQRSLLLSFYWVRWTERLWLSKCA